MSASSVAPQKVEAIVVGAGVAGLFQVNRLREMGVKVHGIEAGSGVGGTWYWNRYPGARFDSQGEIYQYWFDEQLYKSWKPSERFPAQPETEKWLNYVADKLDLKKEYSFGTKVESAKFNESTGRWTVQTDQGETFDTQFFITCCGMLSAPLTEMFPGQNTFKGQLVHTARWPKEGVDYKGKRVAVVGIGATGIQVIQTIAPDVDHLTVYVRTPQYITPMRNPKYTEADNKQLHARFEELKKQCHTSFAGFDYDLDNGSWHDATHEQRQAVYERLWQDGSLSLWLAAYPEIFSVQEASDDISNFVRAKMRARLKNDPKLCDLLIPKDYGFGTHRVPLETKYLEVYLQPNVDTVDVKKTPIVGITPKGIKTSDGTELEFDVIILATGFDAGSGALTRINIEGRGGRKLKEDWGKDIRTTMGLQVHGYPNLFTTAAPLAPSAALCNMTTCLQQQAGWIADTIGYMRDKGLKVMEPTKATEDAWVQHHDDIANATLLTKTDSWYMGSNVPGKPRRLLSYAGGVHTYKKACEDVIASGYKGFELA